MNISLPSEAEEFGDPKVHSRWEFMSFWKFYAIVFPLWVWYSIKNRTVFLGTNLNSFLNNGGLFHYDKNAANEYFYFINGEKSIALNLPADLDIVKSELSIRKKIVIKPAQGLRGKSIHILEDIDTLPSEIHGKYILESYYSGEKEISVLVSRTATGLQIDGITGKVFPSVVGDDANNLSALADHIHRYRIAKRKLTLPPSISWDYIPKKGEKINLGHIGNHNRGCLFVDITISIDSAAKNGILEALERGKEIDFGRFDINFNHLSDLAEGQFKIIEFNGVMAEPTHMYDPRYTLLDALGIYQKHMKRLSACHRIKRKQGHRPTPIISGLGELRLHMKKR